MAARGRDAARVRAGLRGLHFKDVVNAVTIGADGDFLVVVFEELFAVFAGLVPVELVGRQSERIHLAHVAVAGSAHLGDGALVRQLPGMAIGALELRVDAGGDLVRHVRPCNAGQQNYCISPPVWHSLHFIPFQASPSSSAGCWNSRPSALTVFNSLPGPCAMIVWQLLQSAEIFLPVGLT